METRRTTGFTGDGVMDVEKAAAVHDLRTLFEAGSLGRLSDGHLLGRFVSGREEAVFEAILQRHGPMVWGVCRRVLGNHHDAEDAFQATFLVLARKAPSVAVREKLGNWLYGVAYQTALKARTTRARRRLREGQMTDIPEPDAVSPSRPNDLTEWLDRELSRLPEKYRIPIVLCELEGKTHRDVAEQLGWPIGTVSGRLSRARALLAKRWARRGVTIPVGSLSALLAREALAAMPPNLLGPTARAATLYAAGEAVTAGIVSAQVSAIIREVLQTMFLTKLKFGLAILLVALVTGSGSLWMLTKATMAGDNPAEARAGSGAEDLHEDDVERLQGVWTLVRRERALVRPTDEERAAMGRELKITIQGNTLVDHFSQIDYAFTLDTSLTPRRMTLEVTKGPDRGRSVPAIYRMDGDDLVICRGRPGDPEPPIQFSIRDRRPGTAVVLLICKRQSRPVAADKPGLETRRQPSPAQSPKGATFTSLPGDPNATFGGDTDGPFYQRKGDLFFVRYPTGNRFSIYNAATNKASTIPLTGTKDSPLQVVPITGRGNLISLSLNGSNLRRLHLFSLTDWKWYSQEIKEPVTGHLNLILGSSIACYAQERTIYAFSADTRQWSILELPEEAPMQPRLSVHEDSASVEYDGHVYEFRGKTGRWVHTDLRSVIDTAIKAAEDEAR